MVKWFLQSVLGYKASRQLVFSWLFSVIYLQFTCDSRLVLGGSLFSFHLQILQSKPRGLCASTRECLHIISEGVETTGTNRGSVPSDRECAHPPGSVCTSSWRELRPQAPGRVRIKEGSVCTPVALRRPTIKRVDRSQENQDTSWKRKPTNKGNTNR